LFTEHSNALSLSAKKIISLEQSIKAYKFTAKDVAKCLGDCLHGGASLPVTKEELEDMYKAVSSGDKTAADATLALRLAERVASLFAVLDNELQQALVDVPPALREQIRQIPGFEQALVEHKRGASQVTGDLQRLLSSVEEATLHFDLELSSVQVKRVHAHCRIAQGTWERRAGVVLEVSLGESCGGGTLVHRRPTLSPTFRPTVRCCVCSWQPEGGAPPRGQDDDGEDDYDGSPGRGGGSEAGGDFEPLTVKSFFNPTARR
jgi:hypothetical protein